MSNVSQTPLALSKANLQLWTRMLKLLQEQGRQAVDFGGHLADDGIKESTATIDLLKQAEDWQGLATLPRNVLH